MDAAHDHAHFPLRGAVAAAAARLSADDRYAGRGVVIAFLDSGFHPHPDLLLPENRIVGFHDLDAPGRVLSQEASPEASDWHGTQTSVVAAGSGHLSAGFYRGLAPEARVVLVKVGRGGRVRDDDLAAAFEWVLARHADYGIRVVNVSLGADRDAPLADNRVNRLAEEVVAAGVTLVAAAGNSGCTDRPHSLPPATAPSAITVGGYDDGGDPSLSRLSLYCSSFGPTADGLGKPELVALAASVAAPILPRTPAGDRAVALTRLAAASEDAIPDLLEILGGVSGEAPPPVGTRPDAVRVWANEAIRRERILAAHYQRVEGTSFAAPLVSAIVAQMLEANPALTPHAVKHLLVRTADRVPGQAAERQGAGIVNARRAIDAAARERHAASPAAFGDGPRRLRDRLAFAFHDDGARRVALAGDFNGWDASSISMTRGDDGVWRVEIPMPPPGRYRYKLVVDGDRWTEDPANGMREPDPFGAFHSVLVVA